MHKKVAPLMGCVDIIYSDINRGFYDIPRKPFSPTSSQKLSFFWGFFFFANASRSIREGSEKKGHSLWNSCIFSHLSLISPADPQPFQS